MKYALLPLLFLCIGCGDQNSANDDTNNDAPIDANGNPLYTLEDHYAFTLDGNDVAVYGMDKALGRPNNDASAVAYNLNVVCGIRMIVHLANGPNSYTMQIGATDQGQPGCGQFRGLYTLKLTGPTTADVIYVRNDDDYF